MDCWALEDILVRQTTDGYVMVWRKSQDVSKAFLSASPSNGKLKVGTGFIQVSLSQSGYSMSLIILISPVRPRLAGASSPTCS